MKTALLCVSFGTSVPAARKSITAVEEALRGEMPEADFFRAFTSKTIRRILAAKGEVLWSVEEALGQLTDGRYDRVVVQPTHFLYGLEYENLRASVEKAKNRFPDLLLGAPLLSGTQDLRTLAGILSKEYPQEEGTALLLMGHGTPHFSNVVYPAMQTVFHMMGRRDVYVGTVAGWPGISELCAQLKAGSYHRVRTAPLMLVAGDHALNDMAGEEPDSWKSCLAQEGYEVDCILQGLGVLPGVQEMYRNCLRELLK